MSNENTFRENQNNQEGRQIVDPPKGFFHKYCSCLFKPMGNRNSQNQISQPPQITGMQKENNSVNQIAYHQSIEKETENQINDQNILVALKEKIRRLNKINQEILLVNEELISKLKVVNEENEKLNDNLFHLLSKSVQQENHISDLQNKIITQNKLFCENQKNEHVFMNESQNNNLANIIFDLQEQNYKEKSEALRKEQELQFEIVKLRQSLVNFQNNRKKSESFTNKMKFDVEQQKHKEQLQIKSSQNFEAYKNITDSILFENKNGEQQKRFLQKDKISLKNFKEENEIIYQEQQQSMRFSENFEARKNSTNITLIKNKEGEKNQKDIAQQNQIIVQQGQLFSQNSMDMIPSNPQNFIQLNDPNDSTRDPNDQFDPMQTLVSFSICAHCQNQIYGRLLQTSCLHYYHEECLEEMIRQQVVGKSQAKIICYCKKILHSKILHQLKNSHEIQNQLFQNQLNELKNKLKERFLVQQCQNFNCNFFYIRTQYVSSRCLNCDQ